MNFSIVIPVYNRPEETNELLLSLSKTTYSKPFEIVLVEDGSTESSKEIVKLYKDKLNISYYFKENSGPGDSRNYGMKKAKGDYFIIFDSDCIIPENYLELVEKELETNYVDCYGGSDAALPSFSNIQKAINFAMTSVITTGGIRGGSEKLTKFQPRSFNMGISKTAFEQSNGFGNIHPGEDPDLSIRLWKLGFETRLFTSCFVYHKRRIDWDKFSLQVSKFGKARPILNNWHPEYSKFTFWLPSLFVIGFFMSIFALLTLRDIPIKLYFLYFVVVFIVSTIQNNNVKVGYLSVIAVWKQFFGYGLGFLLSYFKINILKQSPQKAFPELFFTTSNSETIKEKTTSFSEDSEKPIEIVFDNSIENSIGTPEISIQKKPLIIGLTGGIGSGKTTLATYFISKGIPVYISDLEAKKVMENPEIINQIEVVFNESIFVNGEINREKLASIVFNDKEKLKQLNTIVHPAVKTHFENWVNHHQNNSILIKEAAILFESGSYKDCDAVISVIAPLENRIKRVIERDNTTAEKIMLRINNQMSDEERIAKSDYVITNNDSNDAKNQADEILKILNNK